VVPVTESGINRKPHVYRVPVTEGRHAAPEADHPRPPRGRHCFVERRTAPEQPGKRRAVAPPGPARRGRWPAGYAAAAFAALAVAAVLGVGGYLVFAADGPGVRPALAEPGAPDGVADPGSRAEDPLPLTAAEVFPSAELAVLKAQELDDCAGAVTGELTRLVREAGCTQAVRGTLRARGYVVTAGMVNLVDAAAARDLYEQIRPLVDAGEGGFAGFAAGAGTQPVTRPGIQYGWHVRGHYLAYAVIARGDGKPVEVDDSIARQVLEDVVETHLRGRVLDRRVLS
jgi:hypothetical protein